MTVLPGLDLDRLAGWLPSVLPGIGTDLRAELIAGGKSNLTYEVTDGTGAWIVRRPPLGHVLATAHDMAPRVPRDDGAARTPPCRCPRTSRSAPTPTCSARRST